MFNWSGKSHPDWGSPMSEGASWWIRKREAIWKSAFISPFPDCVWPAASCVFSLPLSHFFKPKQIKLSVTRNLTRGGCVLGRWVKPNTIEKWIHEFWGEGAMEWPCVYLWRENVRWRLSVRTSDYLRKSTWARWPMGTTKTLRYKTRLRSFHTLKIPFWNWVLKMVCWVLSAHPRHQHRHRLAPPKS